MEQSDFWKGTMQTIIICLIIGLCAGLFVISIFI
jgi:F0F1-type ATP synthase assembly protein I